VYAVLYRDGRLTQPIDTFRQAQAPPAPAPAARLSIFKQQFVLSFFGDSIDGRPTYYRIAVPAANRQFEVRQVVLERKTEESCNCSYVTNLRFTLNGRATAIAQSRPEKEPVVLRK
jgi:hypothetical protein